MNRLICMTSLAALAMAQTAVADESYPKFTADFGVEVENDYTFDSTDKAAELNELFATIEGALSLEFTESTSLNASLVFEPVRDATDDRFFDDHGFYAEELYLRTVVHTVGFTLGKFNPAFGSAWDLAPGIYGADFAEDYELTERLGAGIDIPFEAVGGEHSLSFAVFAADTTPLSDSLIQDRGQVDKDDGGVSNTESPESFALSLSGAVGETGYSLGLQYQTAGTGDAFDQSGVVLGVNQAIAIGGDIAIELLAEGAYFPHFDGAEESAFVGTFGAAVPVGPVTLSGVYAIRALEGTDNDHLATMTGEFEIMDGLSAGLGYRYGNEGGETAHTLGTVLSYEFGI